jgi:hypothetical protein
MASCAARSFIAKARDGSPVIHFDSPPAGGDLAIQRHRCLHGHERRPANDPVI